MPNQAIEPEFFPLLAYNTVPFRIQFVFPYDLTTIEFVGQVKGLGIDPVDIVCTCNGFILSLFIDLAKISAMPDGVYSYDIIQITVIDAIVIRGTFTVVNGVTTHDNN